LSHFVTGDIWADRGGQGLNAHGGVYRVGGSISVHFQVNTDSDIVVIEDYPNGFRRVLFEDRVVGGKEHKLSGGMDEPSGYRIFYLIANLHGNLQEVDFCRVEVLSKGTSLQLPI